MSFVIKMLSAYYVCCICSNAPQKTFTMEARSMNPDQTVPKETVPAGSILFGPHREKTCHPGFANNTGADQPAHPQSDQRLCYSLFGKYHI